jgi:membrane protein YqaA with SNARE-associated domain
MSQIFTDGLIHRLLPYQPEVTLNAIRHFHIEDYPAAAVQAGVGALVASVALYLIGIWLRRLPERVSTESQRGRIEKLRTVANEWLPWLLILSPTPVGGVLIMAAGFFAVRPWLAAAMVVIAEIAWRAAPVL